MKKTVVIALNEEKISAVEMYLGQKKSSLEIELTKYAEQLYLKNVPQNVRDFIDMMMNEKKPAKKPKSNTAPDMALSPEQ